MTKFFSIPLKALAVFGLGIGIFQPQMATAQEYLLGVYGTTIGPRDYYNSSGTRLNNLAALIAQDRANYHRFGIRDQSDENDPVFSDRAMRAQINPSIIEVPHFYQPFVQNIVSCRSNCSSYIALYVYGYGSKITKIRLEIPG